MHTNINERQSSSQKIRTKCLNHTTLTRQTISDQMIVGQICIKCKILEILVQAAHINITRTTIIQLKFMAEFQQNFSPNSTKRDQMVYNVAVAGDITAWFALIKCIVGTASVDSCIHYRPYNTSSRIRAPEISPDYRIGFCRLLQAVLRCAAASWRHPRQRRRYTSFGECIGIGVILVR